MRYHPAHAASSGKMPVWLHGPHTIRRVLSAAVAGAVAFTPAFLVSTATPASADTHGRITVSVSPTTAVTEGATLTYTITSTATESVTLAYTGTAQVGAALDYTTDTAAGSVSLTANTPRTVTVTTRADSLYEGGATGTAETVIVTATVDGTNYGTATGSITDGDAAPTFALSALPNPVLESATTPQADITATLTKASSTDTVITISTADGTAKAGTDYTAVTAQTLTVTAGNLTGTYTPKISITKDTVYDTASIESFTVTGTSAGAIQPTNTAAATATVNIQDAQSAPVITLGGGGNVTEGSTLTYSLSMTPASERETKVDWDAVATSGQTNQATAGKDFTYPASRTVTIAAGQTSGTISVQTLKDGLDEPNEYFDVKLTNPVNATLGATSQVTGTITGGNDAPKVAITPVTVTEGNKDRTAATFTATLSAASSQTVKVNWSTADIGTGLGNAVAGKDYVTKTGTLTFAPGVTTQMFTVEIIGDTIDEGSGAVPTATDGETFYITLTRPDGDYAVDLSDPGPNRTVKITDDDAAPSLTFADKSMKEGNEANPVLIPVTLSNASDHPITVSVATDSTGTTASSAALAGPGGHDYTLLNNTSVVIEAETLSAYPVLLVNGDMVNETDEVLNLKATPGTGSEFLAATTAKSAKVTLQNDDAVPDLEVNSMVGNEGETVAVTGTVTGERQADVTDTSVAVTFAGGSSKGSVAAGADDFVNPGVTVVGIPWNTTSGAVLPVASLKINTDSISEPDETIIATGTGVANTATVTEGIITIKGGTVTPPADAPKIMAESFRLGAGPLKVSGMTKAGAKVTLWSKPIGAPESADWTKVGEQTAGTDGSVMWMPDFTTTGFWFKANDGTNDSNTIKVYLKQDPDFEALAPSAGTVKVNLTGDPKVRGLEIRVLRQAGSGGSWITVGTGKLSAEGGYTRTYTGLKKGTKWNFKAYVYGDADTGLLTNVSAIKSVTVK